MHEQRSRNPASSHVDTAFHIISVFGLTVRAIGTAPLIFVQLLGGLGNQMFQYAAGRALAERHRVPLRMDLRQFEDRRSTNTPRRYALAPFSINASVASSSELIANTLQRWLRIASVLRERGHAFNPQLTNAGPRTLLVGYWQSERYFSAIAPIIRREFTVRSLPSAKDASLLIEMGQSHAVSVHVRRGDYVSNAAANAFHGLMPLNYYHEAATHILRNDPDARFYVFSDDPAWAREYLNLPGKTTIVDHHGPDDGHEDLRLMRACQHHIIANSSFSWWGAWLSERPGKQVIAPRQWFRDLSIDTSDLCPPEWIRL
ncbi:MAG: alpha-1,2-fucosyltransferase [Anaerolineae bacterium]